MDFAGGDKIHMVSSANLGQYPVQALWKVWKYKVWSVFKALKWYPKKEGRYISVCIFSSEPLGDIIPTISRCSGYRGTVRPAAGKLFLQPLPAAVLPGLLRQPVQLPAVPGEQTKTKTETVSLVTTAVFLMGDWWLPDAGYYEIINLYYYSVRGKPQT